MNRLWAIAMAVAILAVGCGVPIRRNLQDRIVDFQRAYRWKNFARIGSVVQPEDRTHFLEFCGDLEKTNIYSAQLQMLDYDEENLEAVTALNYTYSTLPSLTMKSGRIELEWKYRDRAWWVGWPEAPNK